MARDGTRHFHTTQKLNPSSSENVACLKHIKLCTMISYISEKSSNITQTSENRTKCSAKSRLHDPSSHPLNPRNLWLTVARGPRAWIKPNSRSLKDGEELRAITGARARV